MSEGGGPANPAGLVQRRYFRLPDWAGLDDAARAAALRAQAAFDRLSLAEPAPDPPGSGLAHPLADRLLPGVRRDPPARVGQDEAELARMMAPAVQAALAARDGADFAAALEAIASRLLARPVALRQGAVATASGADGRQVRFPRPDTIRPRLEDLRRNLGRATHGPAVFRAALALTALSNCHPFADGNGRTARVVFNLMLAPEGRSYVPLYDLGNRPWGSLTLFLRGAELHGAWAALFAFLQAAFETLRYERFAAQDAPAAEAAILGPLEI